MATRAFLLCGDEKAVHAVTQILDELEICFEHSSEPPFALKRLAVQRFDLLIVDCDNAQNATQVFNSARASNLNKSSIAIAIVEGKAGVPNAFRLGASLVLTKPVSLEQARNTLRTGIGMTRRETQEAKAPAPAPLVPAIPPVRVAAAALPPPPAPLPGALTAATPVPIVPVQVAKTPVAPTAIASAPPAPAPTVPIPKAPEGTPQPAVSAAPASEDPALRPRLTSAPASRAEEHTPALTNFADERPTPTVGPPAFAKAAAAAAGTAPAGTSKFDSVFTGPASAEQETESNIIPAKTDAAGIEEKSTPTLRIEDPLAEDSDALDPLRDNGVPSFGGLERRPFAGHKEGKRSGGKGALIAAVVLVLLMAGGGYAAWASQPNFRDFLVWEHRNMNAWIAALRGHTQAPASAQPQPASMPPVQALPQTSQIPGAPTTDGSAAPNATPNPLGAASTSLNLTPAPMAGPPQVTNPAALTGPQKGASVQTAKQDTTPSHAAASPALVAAAASLPPANIAKATVSDLVEVPEDYADDQVVHRVRPLYPKQARLKKLHGTVVLQAVVNKQGKVDSLQLVSGDPLLAQAAAEAVKQWRYKPYAHNGEPADFQTRVTVDFKLP